VSSLRAGATQSSWWLARGGGVGFGREMVGISWIASPSLAMTGWVSSLRAGAKQSRWWCRQRLDCRVALLLAMTGGDPEPFASL
jgi:hypothetical protein